MDLLWTYEEITMIQFARTINAILGSDDTELPEASPEDVERALEEAGL